MRIAHVLRRLSFDDWGGTEQVVWNLAKAQKATGHEVRLFATTALWKGQDGARDMRGVRDGSLEVVDGIEILRFRPIYPWWPMPKRLVDELDRKGGNPFVPGLGRALREWRPDVIHCHAMARIAELCLRVGGRRGDARGARADDMRVVRNARDESPHASHVSHAPHDLKLTTNDCRLTTKTVISLHGGGANVPGEEAKSLKAPTRGRLPWGKLVDYAMGWVRRVPEDFDGIVCVGEDEYEKYRAKHPHVLFLPNGVDTSLFDENVKCKMANGKCGKAVPQFSILNSTFSILCVARIDRQKNQMMIVEALARHPEMSARLVGPVTQPDYADELRRRAEELGVSGRLTLVGALKPGSQELVDEYRNADLFVLPSRHEPFGIVVLEAWAAGLPVVASDVGGLGRLCAAHPGASVTFPPGDAAAMDAAIEKTRERLKTGAGDVREAARSAAGQYDWSVLAGRLVDFFGQI